MITYNTFFFPGKVPSLNELLNAKAGMAPMKKSWLVHKGKNPGTFKFNKYNEIKSDWKAKVVKIVKEAGFTPVESCYFAYLVVEKTRKRDPDNICSSAIKFISDGLTEAGVIPNDGWDNVLGINTYWRHEPKGEPGVFVLMTNLVVMPCTMETIYESQRQKAE